MKKKKKYSPGLQEVDVRPGVLRLLCLFLVRGVLHAHQGPGIQTAHDSPDRSAPGKKRRNARFCARLEGPGTEWERLTDAFCNRDVRFAYFPESCDRLGALKSSGSPRTASASTSLLSSSETSRNRRCGGKISLSFELAVPRKWTAARLALLVAAQGVAASAVLRFFQESAEPGRKKKQKVR